MGPRVSPLDMAKTITDGIADGTLCWSGKIPTAEKEVPMVLVSERASPADLSKCLYRGVMTHMGVTIHSSGRASAGQGGYVRGNIFDGLLIR